MVFSSIHFLFIFLPLFLLVYYVLSQKFHNAWLLIGSVVFYAYGALENPFYLLLILIAAVVNWGVGRAMEAFPRFRKPLFIAGLVYDFFWLFLYKYAGFFFSSVQAVFDNVFPSLDIQLPLVNLVLPIGISFYTFQIVSYLADVYKRTIPAEKSLLRLGTYLMMFPQLIAGPIVTYSFISKDLPKRRISFSQLNAGFQDFTLGLGFKVLLANRIGGLWADVSTIGYESLATPLAWMGILAYSMQLYFDFYGYSLMAIGLGKMIGFTFPENFNHPYMSVTVSEFWRRWHITLGSWFREYIYIPLGGNRKGNTRTFFNLLIVWLLTGLWHGANWNFLLWGLVLFVFIALEKFVIGDTLKRHRLLGHAYIIFVIPLTWVLFAITDLKKIGIYFSRLFPFLPSVPGNISPNDLIEKVDKYGLLVLVGLLFCTDLPMRFYRRIKDTFWGTLLLLAIFWGSAYYLYIGLNDPFLYFQF